MEHEKTSLCLVGVVAIVAVVGIVLMAFGSGMETMSGKAVNVNSKATCVDTDNGKVPTVLGELIGTNEKGRRFDSKDKCTATNMLYEYYCSEDSKPMNIRVDCTKLFKGGVCSKGKCIAK